jgi:hypothetical protein
MKANREGEAGRGFRFLVMCGAALALLPTVSCGSKTSATPGIGDAATAGSSTASECATGDTRVCVGRGACSGGQACGTDGIWSLCDCGQGGSGSEAGTDAAGGASGGGVAGSSLGGASGGAGLSEAGSNGASAGAAGAVSLSGLSPGDDPCPNGSVTADCSGQCSTTRTLCQAQCPAIVHLESIGDGQVVARTPSHPSAACSCLQPDGNPAIYRLTIKLTPAASKALYIEAPPPWHVSFYDTACVIGAEPTDACLSSTGSWSVWTTDPNAPAVNLVARLGTCP